METKTKIECVTHGRNLIKEERARFKRKMTPGQLMGVLKNGAPGLKILMYRGKNPDDNVVVEYRRAENTD